MTRCYVHKQSVRNDELIVFILYCLVVCYRLVSSERWGKKRKSDIALSSCIFNIKPCERMCIVYRPKLNDGVAGTTDGRQETHSAHYGEEYDEVITAIDRTHSLGRRAQAADAGAVAISLRKTF